MEPVVSCIEIDIPAPTLADNTGTIDRMRTCLEKHINMDIDNIPLDSMNYFNTVMWEEDFKVTAIVMDNGEGRGRVLDLFPKNKEKICLGGALDLGTSKMIFYLVDLLTGSLLDSCSVTNPQVIHGNDILTRIHYAATPEKLKEMQILVTDTISATFNEMAKANGFIADDIYFITIAGNTTMSHFLLGLDPYSICREPYIPVANYFKIIPASELNLVIHKNAHIFVFPNIGSYFGGDLISGILHTGIYKHDKISMLIDVGTNAEVVLGNKDFLMVCAGAAGPALEGGAAESGMMAKNGAITSIKIEPGTLKTQYETIGDHPPLGICGSGLIDLLSELFLNNVIDIRGKFKKRFIENHPRFIKTDYGAAYIVVPGAETETGDNLLINEVDISILIRSKGAMYTILSVITERLEVGFNDLENICIAGTFGNYINPESAISIGMMPDIPRDIYKPVGNTSGKGACDYLLKQSIRDSVSHVCDMITYMELNVDGIFQSKLNEALFIPHTDTSLFPSVKDKINKINRKAPGP